MSNLFNHLLLYTPFRKYYGFSRYYYSAKIRKKLRVYKDNLSLDNTIEYNLTALDHIQNDFSMRRMHFLIHGLLSLEFLSKDSKILVLGPRTENDLLILKGHGFKNVLGLDLITYSSLIQLGDMHNMPFEDNSFDVVICGWTISYSKEPQVACDEIDRVCKPGGVIAFGFDHLSQQNFNPNNEAPTQPDRINSISDIKGMFAGKIQNSYFEYDADMKDLSKVEIQKKSGLEASIVMFIFRTIRKI